MACPVTHQEDGLISCLDTARDLPGLWTQADGEVSRCKWFSLSLRNAPSSESWSCQLHSVPSSDLALRGMSEVRGPICCLNRPVTSPAMLEVFATRLRLVMEALSPRARGTRSIWCLPPSTLPAISSVCQPPLCKRHAPADPHTCTQAHPTTAAQTDMCTWSSKHNPHIPTDAREQEHKHTKKHKHKSLQRTHTCIQTAKCTCRNTHARTHKHGSPAHTEAQTHACKNTSTKAHRNTGTNTPWTKSAHGRTRPPTPHVHSRTGLGASRGRSFRSLSSPTVSVMPTVWSPVRSWAPRSEQPWGQST